jgi:glutamyl-tRNA synthetase
MNPVRVRFAPSPTGPLHIGSARTALFNWLFARRHGGSFVLRIEDTDQTRYVPQSLDDILGGLRWLGLHWDEGPAVGGPFGPYFQSERTKLYREWSHWLVAHGYAYKCWCSPERLQQMRSRQQEAGHKLGYDRHCRELTRVQIGELEAAGRPYVIRFKIPLTGSTTMHDLIRGNITFAHEELEDLVLLKSDGFPTYHLANVVDDHLMDISHIVRADEWISTAPLHVLMYRALGWELPVYAHAPLILNPSGKGKLSKRAQAFSEDGQQVLVQVREFRAAGYLPEALSNFLCNVGWSFGDDREVFSLEEAIPRFDLRDVNPAPARLPYSKLEWLNGVYIRQMAPGRLAEAVAPYLPEAGRPANRETLVRAIPLIQERIKTLQEAEAWLGFFFASELHTDPRELIGKNMDAAGSLAALRRVRDVLVGLAPFDEATLETRLRELATELGLKAGQLFGIIRTAVTGQQVAPPLFGTLAILGQDESVRRLSQALSHLATWAEEEQESAG